MAATIIDGRKIASEIQKNILDEITTLHNTHQTIPQITTIIIGNDPAATLYLRLRDSACKTVGIRSQHIELPMTVSEKTVLDTIHDLNINPDIHGIFLQFPIPKNLFPERLMNAIDPKKDVEGFHPLNMGRILIGDEHLVPCTPLAVLTILEHEHFGVKGKDVVVVNHSTVVGKPLTALLLNRNATVSICHVYTKHLKQYTSNADVLITAAGVPKLITTDHVKEGAFVIDVGIIQTKDGVCGDVDFQTVKEKAGKLTPVPGGVGPVTIACSLQNMMKTYRSCTST
ncbi:MAG: bifunctional methylenetetrahydrofolate dehydrogenase/methenyltetrahydrofolate cyclohydrolase [Euryarchaeota archaeon]|nr:bifunctional methylenetetrahydrofolate dehydrogenase/methenyltetrahydrofolate cyclohydrolase [Euryarchaeota archaeon]